MVLFVHQYIKDPVPKHAATRTLIPKSPTIPVLQRDNVIHKQMYAIFASVCSKFYVPQLIMIQQRTQPRMVKFSQSESLS